MQTDVAFDQFGHQSIESAATCRYQLEDLGAFVLATESALNGFNLPSNSPHADEKFLSVSSRMSHAATMPYPGIV